LQGVRAVTLSTSSLGAGREKQQAGSGDLFNSQAGTRARYPVCLPQRFLPAPLFASYDNRHDTVVALEDSSQVPFRRFGDTACGDSTTRQQEGIVHLAESLPGIGGKVVT